MSDLVEHARRELARIGEDQDTIDVIIAVVRAFADGGHSGGSGPMAIEYLERLLRFEPLSPLTDDPSEWEDRSQISGYPLWQSTRDPRAFSKDGGRTWHLVAEHVMRPISRWAGTEPQEEGPEPDLDDLPRTQLAELAGPAGLVAGVLDVWLYRMHRVVSSAHGVGLFLDLLAGEGFRVEPIQAPALEALLPAPTE